MPVPERPAPLAFEPRDCHVFDHNGQRIEVESRTAASRDVRRASEVR